MTKPATVDFQRPIDADTNINSLPTAAANFSARLLSEGWTVVSTDLSLGTVNKIEILKLIEERAHVRGLTLGFDQTTLIEFEGAVVGKRHMTSELAPGLAGLEVLLVEAEEKTIEVPLIPGTALFSSCIADGDDL